MIKIIKHSHEFKEEVCLDFGDGEIPVFAVDYSHQYSTNPHILLTVYDRDDQFATIKIHKNKTVIYVDITRGEKHFDLTSALFTRRDENDQGD